MILSKNLLEIDCNDEEKCENCVRFVIEEKTEEWCAKHCIRYFGIKKDCYIKVK